MSIPPTGSFAVRGELIQIEPGVWVPTWLVRGVYDGTTFQPLSVSEDGGLLVDLADQDILNALKQLRDGTDNQRQLLDYSDSGAGIFEVRYLGLAPQGTSISSLGWTIRRMSYGLFGGSARVTDIQVLFGAWTNRATLAWS